MLMLFWCLHWLLALTLFLPESTIECMVRNGYTARSSPPAQTVQWPLAKFRHRWNRSRSHLMSTFTRRNRQLTNETSEYLAHYWILEYLTYCIDRARQFADQNYQDKVGFWAVLELSQIPISQASPAVHKWAQRFGLRRCRSLEKQTKQLKLNDARYSRFDDIV